MQRRIAFWLTFAVLFAPILFGARMIGKAMVPMETRAVMDCASPVVDTWGVPIRCH